MYLLKTIAAAALLLCGCAAMGQVDREKVAAGSRIYDTYCLTCHGENLVNTGAASFDLRRLRRDELVRFENSVLNGKSQMPPWKGVLSNADIDSLWHYIRANSTSP